jgi:hypothetical protein
MSLPRTINPLLSKDVVEFKSVIKNILFECDFEVVKESDIVNYFAIRRDRSYYNNLFLIDCLFYKQGNHVGLPPLKKIHAAMNLKQADWSIVFSNNKFSRSAKDYAKSINNITLLNYKQCFDLNSVTRFNKYLNCKRYMGNEFQNYKKKIRQGVELLPDNVNSDSVMKLFESIFSDDYYVKWCAIRTFQHPKVLSYFEKHIGQYYDRIGAYMSQIAAIGDSILITELHSLMDKFFPYTEVELDNFDFSSAEDL